MDPALRFRLVSAAAIAALLGGLALLHGVWPQPGGPAETEPPPVALLEPRGVFAAPPAVFRWKPVTGAVSYRLTLSDQDTVWPLALRQTTETSYTFTEQETRAYSARRKYVWQVEAVGTGGGRVLARGEAYFAISPDTAGAPGAHRSPPADGGGLDP